MICADAINTLAVSVLTYSFNIINWKIGEPKKLACKAQKLLTMEQMCHPKADVDKVIRPRIPGGRGLVQIQITYKTTIDTYLENKEDSLT